MSRRAVLPVLAVAGLLLLLAPPAQAASHSITIANFAFSPASETIAQGDSVTWTNTDQAPHDVTVTSGPVAIHSPTITTGQSWSYTFTTPGTYSYICSIHPDMHATLVVAAAPATTATRAAVAPPAVTRVAVAPRQTAAGAAAHPAATTPAATTVAPTSQAPMTSMVQSAAAAPQAQQPGLNPLLLVAGLVAAVATLCLLLLGSRQDKP